MTDTKPIRKMTNWELARELREFQDGMTTQLGAMGDRMEQWSTMLDELDTRVERVERVERVGGEPSVEALNSMHDRVTRMEVMVADLTTAPSIDRIDKIDSRLQIVEFAAAAFKEHRVEIRERLKNALRRHMRLTLGVWFAYSVAILVIAWRIAT